MMGPRRVLTSKPFHFVVAGAVLAAAVIWVSLTMVARAVDEPATASRISARATSSRASRVLVHPVASEMLATRVMT